MSALTGAASFVIVQASKWQWVAMWGHAMFLLEQLMEVQVNECRWVVMWGDACSCLSSSWECKTTRIDGCRCVLMGAPMGHQINVVGGGTSQRMSIGYHGMLWVHP
eukprot:1161064-Pelagomonas_calceolata.AAC.3